jgi:hypothetical protein
MDFSPCEPFGVASGMAAVILKGAGPFLEGSAPVFLIPPRILVD